MIIGVFKNGNLESAKIIRDRDLEKYRQFVADVFPKDIRIKLVTMDVFLKFKAGKR